jgi:hypothetical protein
MTPQAFSYATVSKNGMLYIPPYGLTECIDYMLKINPITFEATKIPVHKSGKTERWTYGIEIANWIYFPPYNEDYMLAINTKTDTVEHIHLSWPDNTKQIKGKYISFHKYKDSIIALPYGESEPFDYALVYDAGLSKYKFVKLECKINDCKKWHTSQILENKLIAVPRGERWTDNYFPYAVEFDCDLFDYTLTDLGSHWLDIDQQEFSNKKYTTLAKANGKLYAPPYSENSNFDVILKYNGVWSSERTNITSTSRKYFTHKTAANGKIYCPPAGHDEDWSELLIIDSNTDEWHTVSLGIGKESKKYFAGCENSQGKIYWIPRGGCVCEPEDSWKRSGDLAEILVVDTATNEFKTIDISEYFKDNTTIEKYNCSVIVDDKIFALPYGESETFHTMLIFDTISEKVIKTINLNEI